MNYESPEKRLEFLKKEVLDPNSEIYLENLLDLAVSVTYDIHSSGTWKNSKPIKSFLERYSNFSDKVYKNRVSVSDFQCIKTIGQGGFGRVDLVKHKETKNIYAMKVIEKSTYIQNAFNGFWEERDILAKNISDWLVKCFYTFMDLKKLYIVMEYMPGGNLYHWLSTLEEFNDEQTHFYATEMMLAIETLHNMEFLHRDLKPDNMLLDKNGHLKLADFGTCIKIEQGKVKTNFQVGTPDYIAPEVLSKAGTHDLEVGYEIDWWAFGIVLYELFYGETPFEGESTATLYKNIMLYKTTLNYPDDKPASAHYIDFLKGLLTDSSQRMNVTKIRHHPYMTDGQYKWNFDTIRQHETPLIFQVSDEADTQYITFDPTDKRNNITSSFTNNNFFSGENLAFTGFTFNRSHRYALGDSANKDTSADNSKLVELETKLCEIELSKQQLTKKLDRNVSELGQIQMKLSSTEKELNDKNQLISTKLNESSLHLEENIQLKTKFDTLTKQYEASQQNINQLKLSINEKDVEIKTMKADIANISEISNKLKESLEQTENKLSSMTMDLEEKNIQLETLSKVENLLVDERNVSKDLITDIKTKDRAITEYEKQLEMLNNRINELTSHYNKINTANINNNEQTVQLSSMKQKYDQLLREKEAVESKLSLLIVDLKEIKDERDLLRSELRTETLKKTALEKTRDKLNKELTDKTSRFNNLQKKLYETEDQMKIMKQKINISDDEKEQLETKFKIYEQMSVVKRMEMNEAKSEWDDLKEQYEIKEFELVNEIKNLNGRMKEITDELCNLRDAYEEQRSKADLLDSLLVEKDILNRTIKDLKAELEDNKMNLEEQFEINRKIEIELKRSNDQTNENKIKLDEAVKKINNLVTNPINVQTYRPKKEPVEKESNKRVKQLERDILKCKNNLESNQHEIIELKNECQLWREKFVELEQEMEKKNNIIVYLKNKIGDSITEDPESEEFDKQTVLTTFLQGKIEVLKKGKGRHKITWLPYFAVLSPFKMEMFQNENDTVPVQTFELRQVIYVKETTQADSVHIDKGLLPQMLQIIYSKTVVEDNRRHSVMPLADSRRAKGSMMSIDEAGASMRLSNQSLTGIINAENHAFVHVKVWGSQICDFCHQSCSELFSWSMVLECSKCKQRIHPEHINDKKIPACQEAIENISIKLESNEVRMSWLTRFRKLKQYQDSEETRIGPNTYFRSVRQINRASPVNSGNS